jgi:hypothetical protein
MRTAQPIETFGDPGDTPVVFLTALRTAILPVPELCRGVAAQGRYVVQVHQCHGADGVVRALDARDIERAHVVCPSTSRPC